MDSKILKLLSSLLIVLFITNSCKKSDKLNPATVNLNGIYQIGNTINFSPVKMYTANGEVTDQLIIKDYIKRKLDTTYFIFDKTTIPSYFPESEISFDAANMVTWSGTLPGAYLSDPAGYFPYTIPTRYTVFQKSSNGFVLQSIDSIKSFPEADYGNSRARMLFDNSNILKVLSNCGPLICGYNGCTSRCTFKTAYPFIIQNGQIYLQSYACSISCFSSVLAPGASLPGVEASSEANSQIIGSFDVELIKQLTVGDTVVYQNKNIQFIKK